MGGGGFPLFLTFKWAGEGRRGEEGDRVDSVAAGGGVFYGDAGGGASGAAARLLCSRCPAARLDRACVRESCRQKKNKRSNVVVG